MKVYLARSFGAALIYMFAAHGALAQLTAKEVWTEWSDYFSGIGYEVNGTETMSGGTLTITDLSLMMPFPEADGAVTIAVGEIRFSENSDGTVAVALPNDFPIRFDGTNDDDEPVVVLVGYSQSGSSMIVSGSPREMLYNYSAAQVDVALTSVTVNGAPLPDGTARASLSLSNMSTSTQVGKSDKRNYSQRMSADSLTYDFFAADLESDDKGGFKGTIQDIRSEGTGILPLDMDTSDIQNMLEAGFEFDGRFSYASGSANIQGTGDGEDFSIVSSSRGGALGVSMNPSNFSYDASQKGSSVTINTNQFPVPIELQAAATGFSMNMPVATSEEAQDFGFSFELSDFTMSEMLWGMFDPAAVLPRDPATVALNITGKTRVLVDFLDPEVAEMMEGSGTPPFELNALTINKLLISMIGASVAGNGEFTFDNTDMESFDGIPKPTGFIELQLVGLNALLDKLIQMGIVAEEQAMGARMMMGMLAVPGDGPDTLNSRIEINGEGHVLANGQRIQ